MISLGITGGIGSGKSFVSRLLEEEYAIPVYNCDIRARIITQCDTNVKDQLTALMPHLYDEENVLDKNRLAQYLFASEANARRVNNIIHPVVRADLRQWIVDHSDALIVAVESAILYESGFYTEVDRVLFVDAPLEIRLQRVEARDGLSSDEVIRRMKSQRPDVARSRADFCIMNDGRSDLISQLRATLESLNPKILKS